MLLLVDERYKCSSLCFIQEQKRIKYYFVSVDDTKVKTIICCCYNELLIDC